MKKKAICTLLAVLFLTGCSGTDIGIIGGADGPTSIIVGDENGQLTYFDAMPELEEIPAPPGSFSEGWEHTESGSMNIVMENVDEESFHKYVGETLRLAGYPAVHSEVDAHLTEDRKDLATCDGEHYTLQFIYNRKTQEMTMVVIHK